LAFAVKQGFTDIKHIQDPNTFDMLASRLAQSGVDLTEQLDEASTVENQDKARKIIATYSKQGKFKSPVKTSSGAITGTPEQELLAHIISQLVEKYTNDPKYVEMRIKLWVNELKKTFKSFDDFLKADRQKAEFVHSLLLKPNPGIPGNRNLLHMQEYIKNIATEDAMKYLTMYLQDTDLDHPAIADGPLDALDVNNPNS
jgi:hypothetical protein